MSIFKKNKTNKKPYKRPGYKHCHLILPEKIVEIMDTISGKTENSRNRVIIQILHNACVQYQNEGLQREEL